MEDKKCTSIENVKTGSVFELQTKEIVGIDQLAGKNSKFRRLDKFFPVICKVYDYVTIFLIIINIILIILYTYTKKITSFNILLFSVFILFILSRIGVFSLLGASSWSAIQARYFMPIIPFVAITIFPLAWCVRKNDI